MPDMPKDPPTTKRPPAPEGQGSVAPWEVTRIHRHGRADVGQNGVDLGSFNKPEFAELAVAAVNAAQGPGLIPGLRHALKMLMDWREETKDHFHEGDRWDAGFLSATNVQYTNLVGEIERLGKLK